MEIIGGLVQFAIIGVVIWAIVRAASRRDSENAPVDQAASIRRLFVYGLLLATLILASVGTVLVVQELVDRSSGDRNATLALGLAFVIVAGPSHALLLRHVVGRLRDEPTERTSFSWAAYMNVALLVSLIVTIVATQNLFDGLTGVDDFRARTVASTAVWGTVWTVHWFWLKSTFGIPGEVHLAAGSVAGALALTLGLGGLLFVLGDEIYTQVVERVSSDHDPPALRSWIITTAIGGAVWSWYWLVNYLRSERSPLWHVYVLVVGALCNLVAAIAAAATLAYRTAVWFIGNPHAAVPSEHFEFVPVAAAVTIVGVGGWQYHRAVLQRSDLRTRTEPRRTYDYLMAGAGLVSVVVAATVALVALIESITPEPIERFARETEVANRLILSVTLGAIGLPLWWYFWSGIRRHAQTDPAGELGSISRRVHLIVLFGAGGVVALVSVIVVLNTGLLDLLDDAFGGATVRDFSVALSLLVTVTGVAWYHLAVFRSDRSTLRALAPWPAPHRLRHVVLIAPRSEALAAGLALATGATVDGWWRTDDVSVSDVDVGDLAALVNASESGDVAVIVGPDATTVIPFRVGGGESTN